MLLNIHKINNIPVSLPHFTKQQKNIFIFMYPIKKYLLHLQKLFMPRYLLLVKSGTFIPA